MYINLNPYIPRVQLSRNAIRKCQYHDIQYSRTLSAPEKRPSSASMASRQLIPIRNFTVRTSPYAPCDHTAIECVGHPSLTPSASPAPSPFPVPSPAPSPFPVPSPVKPPESS
ncbi:hypothetical protein BO70DRAFT_364228 [Aspergillus heteromorphus CBS 117.55]|uniref:Uncharacterized protein n=1 Tax=Aspergillus heteromorphus CBS 117.55 TaxID=1448321 RepID=A0A317VNI2_9EURO|nr:uncharacterized protein BO70DRAFT_364228 [Aspergillus heteromorphus CBS 117.55]PWY75149.1 hypothetical protein BO70DRAFT_364228 [Aspergillus heteromorphus CBS 117.55]